MPRRTSKKDSPAKLAGRMKRRWLVVLLRSKGEILGQVEAPDAQAAKAAAAVQLIWTKSSATGSWCRSWAERRARRLQAGRERGGRIQVARMRPVFRREASAT